MIAALLKRQLKVFSRRYDYDTAYLSALVGIDSMGGVKLSLATAFMNHRFGTPQDIYYAAKIRAVLQADCGPCLQLALSKAQESGVSLKRLRPVLGIGKADDDIALVIAYVDAVLTKSESLPDLINQVRDLWGEKGLAGLAAAVVAGQFYPLLKRGLGYALTCEPFLQQFSTTGNVETIDV